MLQHLYKQGIAEAYQHRAIRLAIKYDTSPAVIRIRLDDNVEEPPGAGMDSGELTLLKDVWQPVPVEPIYLPTTLP